MGVAVGLGVFAGVVVLGVALGVGLGVGLGSSSVEISATPSDVPVECTDTFQISLSAAACTVDIQTELGVASEYQETVVGDKRRISFNGVASHNVGPFPNPGNPNTIAATSGNVEVPLNPVAASSFTSAQGYEVAIFRSGVAADPFTAEFFSDNKEWNETALTSAVNLGLDCNNGHVQPTGEYHYHGVPPAYIVQLVGSLSPTAPVFLAYAADGFPVYYKFAYNDQNELTAYESGYRLRSGLRGGDGVTAPDGCYDGLYFQDYEFVEGLSELDAANGRTGRVAVDGPAVYHYVVTDNWPSIPIMFRGTPDPSFRHGGAGPP